MIDHSCNQMLIKARQPHGGMSMNDLINRAALATMRDMISTEEPDEPTALAAITELRRAGLNVTAGRVQLLVLMREQPRAWSYQEVCLAFMERYPETPVTVVQPALRALVQAGLLGRLRAGDFVNGRGKSWYALSGVQRIRKPGLGAKNSIAGVVAGLLAVLELDVLLLA